MLPRCTEPQKSNTKSDMCCIHQSPEYLLAECCNTAQSCSQHSTATDRLMPEWPGSIIPLSKTLTLLRKHSFSQSPQMFLQQSENTWWCKHSASSLTSSLHRSLTVTFCHYLQGSESPTNLNHPTKDNNPRNLKPKYHAIHSAIHCYNIMQCTKDPQSTEHLTALIQRTHVMLRQRT
jgi:hypothetical protein